MKPPQHLPPTLAGLITVAVGATVGILACLAIGLAL